MSNPAIHLPALSVGISPCPNDTFIFGSWVLGQCAAMTDRCVSFVWEDVQQLNESAVLGKLDLVKVSAAQALSLSETYTILSAGGAFSKLHGPKLVGLPGCFAPKTIAVPGMQTTATALLRLAWPDPVELIPVRYDQIVKQVRQGQSDAGLLIHESALLLEEYGLNCLLDLGQWWKALSKDLPLPLGCILGRTDLGAHLLESLTRQIQASLDHARSCPEAIWPLIQGLAQELDDDVLHRHIQAYVNNFSRDMGEEGRAALLTLEKFIHDATPTGAGRQS